MKNINRLINKIVWCVNIMLFFLVCCKITPIPNPIVFYDNGIIKYLVVFVNLIICMFVKNYQDKEDILRVYMKQLMADFRYEHRAKDDQSEQNLLREIFDFLIEYKDFYLLLGKRNLFYLLKELIIEICGPKPEAPNLAAYTAAFISYGLYGWIEEWFARGMQESAWEMAQLLKLWT